MKKLFLVLLCAGLFVACGNKNKEVEQVADTIPAAQEVVEEPVVEEPEVAEVPAEQPKPAAKPAAKKPATKPAAKTEEPKQTLGAHAKQAGENIGHAAIEKVEQKATNDINNGTTPTKKRR